MSEQDKQDRERPAVDLPPSDYQLSKADLEADVSLPTTPERRTIRHYPI